MSARGKGIITSISWPWGYSVGYDVGFQGACTRICRWGLLGVFVYTYVNEVVV